MWRYLCAAIVMSGCSGKAADKPAEPVKKDYALAVVVEGWEMWMGNDDFLPADDVSRHPGVLKAVKAGIAKSDFAKTAPAGSTGVLITYSDKAIVRVPMGPLSNLTAEALGEQKDYKDTTGTELAAAIVTAASELDKTKASKKFMLVIGDGNDVNNAVAKPEFAKLKTRFANQGIEVISIVYKGPLSGPANLMTELTANTTTVTSGEALSAQLAAALDKLSK